MTRHPRLPGRIARVDDVRDRPDAWPVVQEDVPYATGYLRLSHETIEAPDGSTHERAVVRPNGAVAVLAIDEQDRILLVSQYRHPVGMRMAELVAGTLDVAGESPVEAAARELAEEADLAAGTWRGLLRLTATPGYSSEQWEVFTATDLRPIPEAARVERHGEEAGIEQWWLGFDEAVEAVLSGALSDALSVAAVLAERTRRSRP